MLYVLSAGVIIVHFERKKTDSFTHIVSVILIQVLVFKFQVYLIHSGYTNITT